VVWRQAPEDGPQNVAPSDCSSRQLLIITGPRLPGALVKTAPDIYIRFHGRRR
jgi:hypothetical protein